MFAILEVDNLSVHGKSLKEVEEEKEEKKALSRLVFGGLDIHLDDFLLTCMHFCNTLRGPLHGMAQWRQDPSAGTCSLYTYSFVRIGVVLAGSGSGRL